MTMQCCEFCVSELPGNARFCGNCGRVVNNPEAPSDLSLATWVSPNKSPGLPDTPPINNSSQSFVTDMMTEQGDEDVTIWTDWLGKSNDQVSEERRTLGPDLLLPGMISGTVQGFGG